MVEPVVVELETEFTCTTNGSFPDPESCRKYYVCNIMPDGELKGFVFDCPPGLSFHAELETDLECSESGIFADPYSCDKYYSCTVIDGQLESFQFDCPPGLLFNAVEGECDYAESVDCSVQEQVEVSVCTGPELSEEQRALC